MGVATPGKKPYATPESFLTLCSEQPVLRGPRDPKQRVRLYRSPRPEARHPNPLRPPSPHHTGRRLPQRRR
jgi:hypothetical protein